MLKFIKQIKILLVLAAIFCFIVAVQRFSYFCYSKNLFNDQPYKANNQTITLLFFDFIFPFVLSILFFLGFYFIRKNKIMESKKKSDIEDKLCNTETENLHLKKEIEMLKAETLREREIDDTQRLYESQIRELKREEKSLRKEGKTKEASEKRKEWQRLTLTYKIYSIEHDRAYYPYRCVLEKEEDLTEQ